jgi:hypothetical protein
MMTFGQFFETATGHAPYDYQRRLAGGDAGRACESHLINVPTGLGKPAAVVLAWLWNCFAPSLNSQPSTRRSSVTEDGSTLNHLWPFRLAWYEAILRVADQRASKRADIQNQPSL